MTLEGINLKTQRRLMSVTPSLSLELIMNETQLPFRDRKSITSEIQKRRNLTPHLSSPIPGISDITVHNKPRGIYYACNLLLPLTKYILQDQLLALSFRGIAGIRRPAYPSWVAPMFIYPLPYPLGIRQRYSEELGVEPR